MTPKYCKDCSFLQKEVQQHPNGKNFVHVYLCGNINCSDPVDASPIPCGLARREVTLCELQGKYYQELKKPETSPNPGTVIQLLKD